MVSSKVAAATDLEILASVADYFKVLSEVSRLQILNSLKSGPMNVMELSVATGLGQANLSKHLKVLTQAGILARQPKGTSAYYEIVDPMIFDFCDLACDRISQRIFQQVQSFQAFRNSREMLEK
ncbi:MAG: metalloregulator ArsR/SmtB family transcription factor [Leptolyngbyaceae cyanobacterium bins.59]|nr:metalloregulator ArsR/SmtB family transcription factor [Leptolyngbyaceae cyanobacterium bins.59]